MHLPAGITVKAIAANGYHSMALTTDGRVLGWGRNNFGQLGDGTTVSRSTPVQVGLPAGTSGRAIAAGFWHSMALLSDGRVLDWGNNVVGQLGDGTTTNTTTPVPVHLPAKAA